MRAVVILLFLAGCVRVPFVTYNAAVMRDNLPPDKAAVTLCAENNVPYIVVDSAARGTDLDEALLVHERVHVRQIMAYRGGCWPFVYRYRNDHAFKVRMELAAYCEQGRWLIEHNKVPEAVWSQIQNTMLFVYGERLKHNCLYEETK
jgi:hypothetical protein